MDMVCLIGTSHYKHSKDVEEGLAELNVGVSLQTGRNECQCRSSKKWK